METSNSTDGAALLARIARIPRRLWRDLLSVYYTNTPVWRWLKSGALVFFGFFLWVGSSLLYAFQPEWGWVTYVMAYGFVLVFWGPLTHMVVVPLAIRLRRTARHPLARTLARHASKLNFSTFLAIVLVLGTVQAGPMMLDFAVLSEGDDQADVGAEIDCTADDELVACQVETDDKVDHAVVLSGERELGRDEGDPPFTLEFRRSEAEEVVGQRQVTVELRDGDGDTLRRFVRTVPAA